MHNWFSSSFSILLASGLVAGLGAQSGSAGGPTGNRSIEDSISITKRAYQVQTHADGRVTGGGADYHAVFDGGSVRFKPALGDEVATDRELGLTLQSIGRGERRVHQPNALHSRAPRVDGKVVTYDRNGVLEQYEIRPSGIKQSYVFPTRPAGQGDLVVRLGVQTELLATPGEGLQELSFRTTERTDSGGVDIGAVIGIDANGRRVRGHMDYDGQHLDLVLPARFVDSAAYPLTLDPPIGTRSCICPTNNDSQADVAYDVTNNVYMVVWTRRFSSSNIVIRGQRVNGVNGALIGSFVTITAQNSGENTKPSIANVNQRDRFVVAWEWESRIPISHQDIRARSVPALSGTMGSIETIAGLILDETGVAVGGETTLDDDECVMVYRDSAQGIIWKEVTVRADGTLSIVNSRTKILSSSSTAPIAGPAISKAGGVGRAFLVAWKTSSRAHAFRAVSANSAILSAVSTNAGIGLDAMTCAGDGRTFYTAFEFRGGTSRANVQCLEYSLPSSSSSRMVFRGQWIRSDNNNTDSDPAVAFLGDRPAVAFVRGTRAFGTTLSPSCRPQWGRLYSVGTTAPGVHSRPRIASTRGGGSLNDKALIVTNSSATGQNDILVTLWQGLIGGPVVNVGPPGCNGGGQQSVWGKIALGERVTWRLSGAIVERLWLGWRSAIRDQRPSPDVARASSWSAAYGSHRRSGTAPPSSPSSSSVIRSSSADRSSRSGGPIDRTVRARAHWCQVSRRRTRCG